MLYELDRRPNLIRPPAFQPVKVKPRVKTEYPDVALSPIEWCQYHLKTNQRVMSMPDMLIK